MKPSVRRRRQDPEVDTSAQQLNDLLRTSMDYQYYLDQNPELGYLSPTEAADHYRHEGWREGRNPTPVFDTSHYVSSYPDVVESGQNPFLHYLIYGRAEGRLPCPAEPPASTDWEPPVRAWPDRSNDQTSPRVLLLTSEDLGSPDGAEEIDWESLESGVHNSGARSSRAVMAVDSEALGADGLFWKQVETPHIAFIADVETGLRHHVLMQRWPATRFVYLSRGLGGTALHDLADEQNSLRLKNKAQRLLQTEVSMIASFDGCVLERERDLQILRELSVGRAVRARSCDFRGPGFGECIKSLIQELLV